MRCAAIGLGVAAAILLVGCGSGSASSSNSARSQFIARTNGICRSAQKHRLDPKTLDAAVALLNKTATELAAVKPPADLRAGYQRFLALVNKKVAVAAKLARDLHERNPRAIRSLKAELNSHAVNDQARQLGLTVCAEEVR